MQTMRSKEAMFRCWARLAESVRVYPVMAWAGAAMAYTVVF